MTMAEKMEKIPKTEKIFHLMATQIFIIETWSN